MKTKKIKKEVPMQNQKAWEFSTVIYASSKNEAIEDFLMDLEVFIKGSNKIRGFKIKEVTE